MSIAAIAAAEVARFEKIGAMVLVITNQSKGRGSLGITIVLPGTRFGFLLLKILLLIGEDSPFGRMIYMLEISAVSLRPPDLLT